MQLFVYVHTIYNWFIKKAFSKLFLVSGGSYFIYVQQYIKHRIFSRHLYILINM